MRARPAGSCAETLDGCASTVTPGVTTKELDRLADALIVERGAPSRPSRATAAIPATLCISVNEEVVHGIPGAGEAQGGRHRRARPGRASYEGYYGDAARTGGRGPRERRGRAAARRHARRPASRRSSSAGPATGSPTSAHAVQTHVESHGFSVVRDFVGHGIGTSLHEEPQVPNYGPAGRRRAARAGHGAWRSSRWSTWAGPRSRCSTDGWTAVTRDGSLAAHFEHTVAMTERAVDPGPAAGTPYAREAACMREG